MKRLLTRAFLFLLVVYFSGLLLNSVYTFVFTRYKADWSKKNWVLVRKADVLNYAALGSSRVFHMIDVPLLNQLTGRKGINLGDDGCNYADNYALLIKYTEQNTIRNLILNVDEFCFNSKEKLIYPFSDFQYMPYFFEDSINGIYKNNVSAFKYYLWTTVPVSRYIEFNEQYKLGSVLWLNQKSLRSPLDSTQGTVLLTDLNYKAFNTADTTSVKPEKLVVDANDLFYFNKLVAFCKVKKINLILVTPPLYTKGIYAPDKREKINQYIEGLAIKNGLTYINFYGVPGLQEVRNFRDLTHTNSLGTDLYTRYLANCLQDKLQTGAR